MNAKWIRVGAKLIVLLAVLSLFAVKSSRAASITSTTTGGNWNDTTTWVGGVVPGSSDDVTIANGATVTINTNFTVNSLTVGQGTSGILTFDSITRTITIAGDVTVASGGTFITQSSGSATHTMTIGGNLTNNGTFDMSRGGTTLLCDVTFNKNGNQTVSGTGATTRFNNITLNMGTSKNNTLEISSTNFAASAGFLTLTNGTLKMSGSYTFSNTFFSSAGYTIASTQGIWLNNTNVTVTAQDGSPLLDGGTLRITGGTYNVGTSTGSSLTYKNNAAITIEGGTLNIAGRLSPKTAGTSTHTVTYNQSGGTVTVVISGSISTLLAGFDVSISGSSFTMSGGTIVLQKPTSFTSDYLVVASTNSITGGTIQVGNSSTQLGQTMRISSTVPLFNLTVNTTNAPTATLLSNITVKGDVNIQTGAMLSTTLNMTTTGNWTNSGTFTAGSGTVTFNGTSQTLTGNTTFNNFTINAGSTVDTGTSLATVNGTYTNNGQLKHTDTHSVGSSGTFVDGTNVATTDLSSGTASFGSTTVNSAAGNTTNPYDSCGNLPNAVQRFWQLTVTTSGSATIKFSYRISELNGRTASTLKIFKCVAGGSWTQVGSNYTYPAGPNASYNSVQADGISLSSTAATYILDNATATAATFVRFEAKPDFTGVSIEWETSAEPGVGGYQLERSLEGTSFSALGEFVVAQGSAVLGATYSVRDNTLRPGELVRYRLVEFSDGGRIIHGPITAALTTANYRIYLLLVGGTRP